MELRPADGQRPHPANLTKYGIKTLALAESCAHVQASKQSASVEDIYQGLTDAGQSFDVPQKSSRSSVRLKAQISSAQSFLALVWLGRRNGILRRAPATRKRPASSRLTGPEALLRLGDGLGPRDLQDGWLCSVVQHDARRPSSEK